MEDLFLWAHYEINEASKPQETEEGVGRFVSSAAAISVLKRVEKALGDEEYRKHLILTLSK